MLRRRGEGSTRAVAAVIGALLVVAVLAGLSYRFYHHDAPDSGPARSGTPIAVAVLGADLDRVVLREAMQDAHADVTLRVGEPSTGYAVPAGRTLLRGIEALPRPVPDVDAVVIDAGTADAEAGVPATDLSDAVLAALRSAQRTFGSASIVVALPNAAADPRLSAASEVIAGVAERLGIATWSPDGDPADSAALAALLDVRG